MGCPRFRFVGCAGMGNRSTNCTNVTSNESWDSIEMPPIVVMCDDYNDRSYTLPGQVPSLVSIYDQASTKQFEEILQEYKDYQQGHGAPKSDSEFIEDFRQAV